MPSARAILRACTTALTVDGGELLFAWRGPFIDATPMSYGRGTDQVAVPGANPLAFHGNPLVYQSDEPLQLKHYRLDEDRRPSFIYQLGSQTIEDTLEPAGGGPYLQRSVTVTAGRHDMTVVAAHAPSVTAGSRVELTFINDHDMSHNLVIARDADRVARDALDLGLQGHNLDYVPQSDDILAHTGLMGPGSQETIFIVAPMESGNYAFVCTFPGHTQTMRGRLRVLPP